MTYSVNIDNIIVGRGHPCLVIAEAGVNHNGDMELAHKLIDAAKKSGANAVKFQSFVAEDLVTPQAEKAVYQVQTTGSSGNQCDMLKALELTYSQQEELKAHCEEIGIIYLCTPYEEKSADLLKDLDVAAYKIASTDTNNLPFLRYIAKTDIPVILSTGMSSIGEVEDAVNVLKSNGLTGKIIILQCTSEYPVPINEINLQAMKTMEQAFDCPVGFSDHTPGIGASPWAVALGASVIEKHFTLNRNMDGPDHRASIEPHELKILTNMIRDVEAALGDGIKRPMPSEIKNKTIMQKSLTARRNIPGGKIIKAEDLVCRRPGDGLLPKWFDKVSGKKATRDIKENQTLTFGDVLWG
jgi:N,N'-diacetyllegionaminate synthase